MPEDDDDRTAAERWAHFRFGIIGQLLAAKPRRGELRAALEELSMTTWDHPTKPDAKIQFAPSTIERWLYKARHNRENPVKALRRKTRKDLGQHPKLTPQVRAALHTLYSQHRDWHVQLLHDNLVEVAERDRLGAVASYSVVLRHMRETGMRRIRLGPAPKTEGQRKAAQRLEEREVRSYEMTHVGALYHYDFHECSREVITSQGELVKPRLFAMLDDCSRVCCHAQWYLHEDTESTVHGLSQGFQKFGLCWGLMSDRGKAMRSAEVAAGLLALSISRDLTLAYSPYQNGKQEHFWTRVEGRLMAMLSGVKQLDLATLNEATQAWVLREYNRGPHTELGMSPLERFASAPSSLRDCPDAETLRRGFRRRERRTLRRSDCTLSLRGVRFEVPSRLRNFKRLHVRFAEWDLSYVDIEDPHTGTLVARLLPVNKARNASGKRRMLAKPPLEAPAAVEAPDAVAPLLDRYMRELRESGLPPPYIPLHENTPKENTDATNQDQEPTNEPRE